MMLLFCSVVEFEVVGCKELKECSRILLLVYMKVACCTLFKAVWNFFPENAVSRGDTQLVMVPASSTSQHEALAIIVETFPLFTF